MSKNTTVITLTSGTQLITKVAAEQDEFYVLRNPMEMVVDNSDPHVQRIYLSRFVPYSDDNMVVIYKTAVESLTLCSQRFNDMYENKLTQFEASKSPITDPDKTEVIDGHINEDMSDSEDNEEEGYIDEGLDEGFNNRKAPITYH